ncbi:bifunctional phosphoribosylaminoimidazolecarboxamide formyltransferase/IMP cyclohydrolase [Leifsonia sp. Root112D2]|jgi:phosphoribosylaminoimidazolecarboxamide formyltransferase/IMP cyclohydrolase|uniref:bifunctional phosphoribosylaminoimidazolecarboxamide formyltransferase/IMP cyclohydrolase n=1 Tax=Leifsonia sp. Root112D2 TaxID=1736426 RepID=UPI0006FA7EAA|nr:bifunctional phosphoribosylaminoimidazolecarboxamide formyltransferase/IMP cyclohydrolase [Leifsonia sp. Root112D2]KQV07259.1 phosphoribosylaminoimidazolecarboxamide formyltransferase [Leifsonia sp. Root112D2]
MSAPSQDPSLYRVRDVVPITRALISVSDKSGLLELAAALSAAGVEMVSTGSTAAKIRDAGFEVTDVAALTGFPESLDGRVKTLHPAVHAGLLADLRLESHEQQLAELGIAAFQLVVVNLYPFAETVASGASEDDTVEQIDIGGPSMVRASAKNYANVAVVVSPSGYEEIASALAAGGTTLEQRKALAVAAFRHTASYDVNVATWLGGTVSSDAGDTGFAGWIGGYWNRASILRYGENSHQRGALYEQGFGLPGIAQAEQLHGKAMSYNNYVDADAALRAAYDFDETAVAVIKHANPCGIAVGDDIADAHRKAHACDPVSAYGGVIAANRTVTLAMAETVKDIFTEVLVAPDFEPDALELLSTKKNLRLLRLPAGYDRAMEEMRQISGGMLVQSRDNFDDFSSDGWQLVAGDEADAATRADLEFAWKACRAVKSNAILLAHDGASVGVGMGQVNRVDSCALAITRAGERVTGSVAASDAFFPFADGAQLLIDAGVRAIVQPGGSIRDEEVVAAATAAGVTMYFTGERHFYH